MQMPNDGSTPADDKHLRRKRERLRSLIGMALSILLIAIMLWLNVLDVRLFWARLFYGLLTCWLVVSFLVRRFRAWQVHQTVNGQVPLPHRSRFMSNGVELGLSVLTLLLALEAAARALPPLSNSSINYPGERFVWPDRYLPRNSLGLNDVEPGRKTRGPRILVLGDSYVEGAGVSRPERFCSRLQELLRVSQPDAKVIAGGVGGWNTQNEARFLERHGEALAPNVVVVGYVLNDAERPGEDTGQPGRWEIWLQTRLRSYLCYRIFRWRKATFGDYWKSIREQHKPGSESWQTVESALEKIATWCRRREIPCELVVLPIFTAEAEKGRAVMDQVVKRASAAGIHSYHALDDFEGRWSDFAVSPHDAHPNPAGHERLAQRIAGELKARGIVRPGK